LDAPPPDFFFLAALDRKKHALLRLPAPPYDWEAKAPQAATLPPPPAQLTLLLLLLFSSAILAALCHVFLLIATVVASVGLIRRLGCRVCSVGAACLAVSGALLSCLCSGCLLCFLLQSL
jgi:hypothetical protein